MDRLALGSLVTVLKPLFESNSETPTAPLKIKNAFIVFKFEEEADAKNWKKVTDHTKTSNATPIALDYLS